MTSETKAIVPDFPPLRNISLVDRRALSSEESREHEKVTNAQGRFQALLHELIQNDQLERLFKVQLLFKAQDESYYLYSETEPYQHDKRPLQHTDLDLLSNQAAKQIDVFPSPQRIIVYHPANLPADSFVFKVLTELCCDFGMLTSSLDQHSTLAELRHLATTVLARHLSLPPARTNIIDDCIALSNLPYESAQCRGCMVFVRQATSPVVEFKHQTPTSEASAVRKLIEMSSDNYPLIATRASDLFSVSGIGIKGQPLPVNSVLVRFVKQGVFEVCLLASPKPDTRIAASVFWVQYGRVSLPRPRFEKPTLEHKIQQLFEPQRTNVDINKLWSFVEAAIDQHHGTMLVISANAAQESERLSKAAQAQAIVPVLPDPKLLFCLTAIDGAVMMDPEGRVHAVGVILDGLASAQGSRARGARYNSAVRYTLSAHGPVIAIVISEDGAVDCIGGP